tara:strand:+ start:5607 stop:6347 length:741 start_codon:yes stop_codon:yes gene_type:complete
MKNKEAIKLKILKLSAITDRGQRLNKLISPVYQEKCSEIENLVSDLHSMSEEINEKDISGDWELIYSNVELFRSSPFFLAIEEALNNKSKSDLFFKLHQLQVGSFGISTIGKITQNIDFQKKELISSFDTIIFGLTTIPIIGWFKLLPTFGGRVLTISNKISLKDNMLEMTIQKTKVIGVEGLNRIPIFSNILMDKWYPVNQIWSKLPWNKEQPNCNLEIFYIDEDMRITKDKYGSLFIYIRPSLS